MLPIGPVIDRLATEVPALRRVSGIAALSALSDALTVLPAAYVMPGQDRPQEPPGPAAVQAFDFETVTVALVVRNVTGELLISW